MLEHPYQDGWTLVTPEKPDERTDNLYRFRMALTAKNSASLSVVEERTILEETRIACINTPALLGYMQTGKMSDQVKQALQHVIELQTALLHTQHQQELRKAEIKEIGDEQARIRQTMAQLDHTADLYKRYTTKLDKQETRIETLREELKDLQTTADAQHKTLDNYIGGLDIE